jgi:hypothetical protein
MKHSLDMNIRTGHLHIYPYPKLIMNEHFGDFSNQIICDSLPMLSALQRISNPDSAHVNPFSHLRAPNLLLASSKIGGKPQTTGPSFGKDPSALPSC